MKNRKYFTSAIAAVVSACLCIAALCIALPTASAASASELAAQIGGIGGLSASASGSTVNVSGSADVGSSGINLNIDSGTEVVWNANLSGSATLNNYLLTLGGSGTFTVAGGTISNTSGAGGTVYINGPVTLSVTGGNIDSPGSGSAVTVAQDRTGVVINVGGSGSITSKPSGYAINDGSGMDPRTNSTKINITAGGLVEAGSACAIRSMGRDSVVTITGGTVRNSAASNPNSTIYMNYAPPPAPGIENIIISGGLVETTNPGNQSYVVQTSQNVSISGGEVKSIAGRTVNLVGLNSIATVTGGRVSTQTGTAISTATTTLDDVTNAKVVISGGVVEATGAGSDYSGTAVKITGTNSTVSVSGDAIVTAKAGLAIDASGRPANGAVSVSGGLVFAWGNATNKVVGPATKPPVVTASGVVAAWNTTTGTGAYPYMQTASNDLSTEPSGSVEWDNGTGIYFDSDGITYGIDKFFPLDVTVIHNVFTVTVINSPRAGEVRTFTATAGSTVDLSTEETPIRTGVNPNQYPINGNKFVKWKQTSGASITINNDESIGGASFTMPSGDVTVTANFLERHLLHVEGGNIQSSGINFGGSPSYGYYYEDEEVPIHGNSDYVSGWQSSVAPDDALGSFVPDAAQNTSFKMPNNPARVYWEPAGSTPPVFSSPHTTTVVNGKITTTTSGAAPDSLTSHKGYSGTGLFIEANSPDDGYEFDFWVISNSSYSGGTYFVKNSDKTLFIMPGTDVTVTATYRQTTHSLTVRGGTGSGDYLHNAAVDITAPDIPGMRFAGWTIDIGSGDFIGATNSPATSFRMPDCDTVISAHYEYIEVGDSSGDRYKVTVINAPSSGQIEEFTVAAGEVFTLSTFKTDIVNGVNPNLYPVNGNRFVEWVSTDVSIVNAYKNDGASFAMPDKSVVITAVFEPLYLLAVKEGSISEEQRNFTPEAGSRFGGRANYGYYAKGDRVSIDTDVDKWLEGDTWLSSGGSFDDARLRMTTFTMPGAAVVVYPSYVEPPNPDGRPQKYTVTVINGTVHSAAGEGILPSGTTTYDAYPRIEISVEANAPTQGREFIGWSSDGAELVDESRRVTLFTMPARDVTITAMYSKGSSDEGK